MRSGRSVPAYDPHPTHRILVHPTDEGRRYTRTAYTRPDMLARALKAPLDAEKDGSKIVSQGAAEVNNRLGLNCFACHSQAQTGFDFICEQDHGCSPIPITRPMFTALQRSDPRCKDAPPLNEEEKAALAELAEVVKTLAGH